MPHSHCSTRFTRACLAAAFVWAAGAAPAVAQTTPSNLKTHWAADVRPESVLPEYPRPDLVRAKWQSLNGPWDFAITDRTAGQPGRFTAKILVPFPVQSQLGGVRQTVTDQQRVWYHRRFRAPRFSEADHVLLHFGAVDWESEVIVNGRSIATHSGGYDPFTIDITDALTGQDEDLLVSVWDPTDKGPQPRGKQVLDPKSIWYTAVTGIWQTVWLEVVPSTYIAGLQITSDVDAGTLTARLRVRGRDTSGRVTATVTALNGQTVAAEVTGPADQPLVLLIKQPHLWSPSDPFLYTLRVRLGGDSVESYAGMRKIAVQRDAAGVNRLFLNNEPLFEYGLLDQGWWPDGLYTAPTDEALRSDIETTKRLGFNLIRKHVKVEPARWYYHCDRIGLLVWQDMPSGGRSTPDSKDVYASELEHVVDALRNHPSIVMWVPFNEGWGQHDTEHYVTWLKQHDPTRLVNNASGWTDKGVGDVSDVHEYPGPAKPLLEPGRAAVLGEFGGLGLPLEGHTWIDKGNWGYRSFATLAELGKAYLDLLGQLRILAAEGLAAAVYTQTTDVEVEVNGIMTYDRAVVKLPAEARAAHAALFSKLPEVRPLVPASDREPQAWRYTMTAPAADWYAPAFDASRWQQGMGGFGAPDTPRAHVGTAWQTRDIWIRRTFDLEEPAPQHPHLRIFHDEDADVYLNGTLVATLAGYNGSYAYVPLDAAARSALRTGQNTLAVHVKQTRGGQFIDVGLVDVIER